MNYIVAGEGENEVAHFLDEQRPGQYAMVLYVAALDERRCRVMSWGE